MEALFVIRSTNIADVGTKCRRNILDNLIVLMLYLILFGSMMYRSKYIAPCALL